MKMKRGRNRLAVIMPLLGIAVKLPIIHLWKVASSLFKMAIKRRFKQIRLALSIPADCEGFALYRNLLFGGILDNWREFLFFYRTKNPFLQPTYLSLLGLINIQKIGKPCLFKREELWSKFYEINGDIADDGHHFRNPDNFCFDNGKIKIVDYGNKNTRKIVARFGAVIAASFDKKT